MSPSQVRLYIHSHKQRVGLRGERALLLDKTARPTLLPKESLAETSLAAQGETLVCVLKRGVRIHETWCRILLTGN